MTKKIKYAFISSTHFTGRAYLVAAVIACLIVTSCFSVGSDRIDEFPKDSVSMTYTLKDKRRAEIKYEKLVRQFTPYAWLSGISQPSTQIDCYIVITAILKNTFGRDKVYRWIDAYPGHAVYYTKVDRLVFIDDNVFIKYTYIPAFPADDYWHYSYINSDYSYRNRNPFGGNPRLLVKYGRYKGTGSLRGDKDDPSRQIHSGTYKWPNRYIWDDVSKEDFDKAAEVGDIISLNDIASNGKFEFYDFQGRSDEDIYYYGKRIERETTTVPKTIRKSVDYYDYYSKRIIKDSELDLFLSSVKTGDATKVEELLNKNPALIDSYDPDGMTALHLALLSRDRYHLLPLLYKFKPRVNVIDYKGRTPLKIALISKADARIIAELGKMGGKNLYDDCSSEEALNKEIKNSFQKGYKQNKNISNWLGDDVYQVWVEDDRSRPYVYGYDARQTALFEGRERIIRELRLSGASESELSKRIELILDNAHVACSRLDKNARIITHFLVRICAPDLRKLVDQYGKQK